MAARLPEPTVDPAEVDRVVAEVLSRPDYADLRPGPLDRVGEWLLSEAGRVLEALGGTGTGARLGLAVLVVAVLTAAVLALRFALGTRRDPAVAADGGGQVGRRPREWAEEAEAHERAGDLRQAARCRYRALVAELSAAGLVDEVPGRTAGEYLAAVATALPAAAEPFATVTSTFEAAWYGRRAMSETDLEDLRAAAAEVLRAAGAPAGAPAGAGGRR